jgi:fructose 1,6-bisphosphate aldolase/phosphatase
MEKQNPKRRREVKRLALIALCLLAVGAFVLNSTFAVWASVIKTDTNEIGHLRATNTLNSAPKTESITKAFGKGFMGPQAVKLVHDKAFRARAARAFNEGRAVVMSADMTQEQIEAAADDFLKKSGDLSASKEEVVKAIVTARDLMESSFTDSFLKSVLSDISKIDAKKLAESIAKEKDAKNKAAKERSLVFLTMMQEIAAKNDLEAARKAIVKDTRYVIFMFGEQGFEPALFTIGDVFSEENRQFIAHIGTFPYEGSANIQGGARTIYNSLLRTSMLDVKAFQALVRHELSDMAAGQHVALSATDTKILRAANKKVDDFYRDNVRGALTEVMSNNEVVTETPKIIMVKERAVNEFGAKATILIKGTSKVHPGIMKGSGKKVTITVAKADVGSPGGHGTVDPAMLDAVAEEWAAAAERGEIKSFFLTRCGDDIMVVATHGYGENNPLIHQHIWDGFIKGGIVAKDKGYYAAFQDILAESFSGNVKGAGPGVCEMEMTEREAETLVLFQADKCAPQVFNNMLYYMLVSPTRSTWPTLGGENYYNLMVQLIDFERDNKKGALGTFSAARQQTEIWSAISDPADISFFRAYNEKTKEPMMTLTASRLHDVGGEYVGKDDPAMLVRAQKDAPAVGEITMQALVGLLEVEGWMRGSSVGPVLPVALTDAKIGGNDGPPLMTSVVFNLNNAEITGIFDAFAANPMIREVQARRSARALERFTEGFSRPGGTKASKAEIAYQKGQKFQEDLQAPNWQAFPEDSVEHKKGTLHKDGGTGTATIAEQRAADAAYTAAGAKVYQANRDANTLKYLADTWGKELLPVAAAFHSDLFRALPDNVKEVNNKKNGKVYPVMINFDALVKNSPDGVMALEDIVEDLGEGNIKLVLHVERNGVSDSEIDAGLAKINEITKGYTTLSRSSFAAIVVGTDPAAISADVLQQLGTPLFEVIGPTAYVKQFKAVRVVADKAAAGQVTSMAKAINLGMELIPAEGKMSNDQLKAVDALLSVDAEGDFHVASSDVTGDAISAAKSFAAQVEQAVRV